MDSVGASGSSHPTGGERAISGSSSHSSRVLTREEVEEKVRYALETSRNERADKLRRLSESGCLEAVEEINALETALGELSGLYSDWYNLQDEERRLKIDLRSLHLSSDSCESEEGKKRIESRLDEINNQKGSFIGISGTLHLGAESILKKYEGVIKPYGECEFTEKTFSIWRALINIHASERALHFSVATERVLNIFTNRLLFLSELQVFVVENKRDIFSFFRINIGEEGALENARPKLVMSEAESHHQGKSPVAVIFSSKEGQEIGKVFYKPRDARIDTIVINTFKSLNDLKRRPTLPIYDIMTMMQQSSVCSIWEYIEGDQLTTTAEEAVEMAIIHYGLSEEEAQHLRERLAWLNRVCLELGITDLHAENLIFRRLPDDSMEIVPIDLESVHLGDETGLLLEGSRLPVSRDFSEEEARYIQGCKEYLEDIPFRFVPMTTRWFTDNLQLYTDCFSVVEGLRDADFLIREGIDLEGLLLNDFLHSEVPYFTEYKNKIYYGKIDASKCEEEGVLIGHRSLERGGSDV